MSRYRVFEDVPCNWPGDECDPRPGFRCEGCNGDNTRMEEVPVPYSHELLDGRGLLVQRNSVMEMREEWEDVGPTTLHFWVEVDT